MTFGLRIAPATFQRIMNEIFEELEFCRVYSDDIVIFSKVEEEHAHEVIMVLTKIKQAGLWIEMKKCTFGRSEIDLIGHGVSASCISVRTDKVKATLQAAVTQTKTKLRSFLGLASNSRRFIKVYAKITAFLQAQTTPKTDPSWSNEMSSSFDNIKTALTEPPVLIYPDFVKASILEMDASSFAAATIFARKDNDGKVHHVTYDGRTVNPSEKK